MDAKDLRIGNYIYLDKPLPKESKLITVSAYHIKDILQCELASVKHMYLPIPLTEEWLLKFGFIKREDYYFLRGFKIRFWEGVNIEYKGISIYEVVGFSVNDLQNLYFALTLKELASDSAQL